MVRQNKPELLALAGFNKFLQVFTSFYKFLQVFTSFYKFLQAFTGSFYVPIMESTQVVPYLTPWVHINKTLISLQLKNEPKKLKVLHYTRLDRFASDKHLAYWAHS
jgi:hypothetical protein